MGPRYAIAAVKADGSWPPRQIGDPLRMTTPGALAFDVGPAGSTEVAYAAPEDPSVDLWRCWIGDLATGDARQVAAVPTESRGLSVVAAVLPRFTPEHAVLFQPIMVRRSPILWLRPGDDEATVLAEGKLLNPAYSGQPAPCAVIYAVTNRDSDDRGTYLLPRLTGHQREL